MVSGRGITPWHGLGTVVSGLMTTQAAIEAAHLGWNVELKPIYVDGRIVEDNKATVRSDNGRVLAIVGNRYEIIQNSTAFEFFDEVLGAGQAYMDTAGALKGGRRVWMSANVPGKLFLKSNPSDTVEKYILLHTSHDGSSGMTVQIVSTRVVCANTLSVAMRGASNVYTVRHTRNANAKVEEAQRVMGLVNGYYSKLDEVIQILDQQAMSKGEMVSFAEKLFPSSKEEISTRNNNIRSTVVDLFSNGRGNNGKTRYDALNAVTDFVTHSRATRGAEGDDKDENRFASSVFGSGMALTQKAFNLLVA